MSSLLLAVDTSGKNGSVALCGMRPGQTEIDVVEIIPLSGGTFSAELVPQIAALLKRHGYTKSDFDAFAVATGPGSFTGLRVGLAAIKALAEALQKPIVAISVLAALAWSNAASRTRVLTALDAGRGDLYVGDYESNALVHEQLYMHSERLLSREELVSVANGKTVITPDKQLVETLQLAGIRAELVDYPNSIVIARMGLDLLRRGETVRPEELEANYIRRSDAEIFSKPPQP
jgi:tRNA threonylcarbamoyladenosine biosynthesis protein TsaB